MVRGATALRDFYERLLADPPPFAGTVKPALRHGDFALTSTHFPAVPPRIAHRQPDGSWLWIADQPNVVS